MKKFLPKTSNNASGFTLIELLVVISIIAILSVVGIALFTTTQGKARDTKRVQDITAMSKAMEVRYENGVYQTSFSSTWFADGQTPDDPTSTKDYTSSGPSGTGNMSTAGYTICASLENSTGNANNGTGSGLGATSVGAYFCRRNSQ